MIKTPRRPWWKTSWKALMYIITALRPSRAAPGINSERSNSLKTALIRGNSAARPRRVNPLEGHCARASFRASAAAVDLPGAVKHRVSHEDETADIHLKVLPPLWQPLGICSSGSKL